MVFVFLELMLYIAFGIKLKINVFHKCHQSRCVKIFPVFLRTISTYYLMLIAKGFSVFCCTPHFLKVCMLSWLVTIPQ